jgi:glucokinase
MGRNQNTNPAKPLLLAVEIGGTKLQLVTGTSAGEVIDVTRLDVDPGQGAEGIQQRLSQTIREQRARFAWQAAGVGYGGPIDARTGTICCSFQVEGWAGFPLAAWMEDLLGVPVVVENDSNAAALGEALSGSGQGCDPVFYTNSGSGVGGGLVTGGRIYHGAVPGEAEFGHVRLDPSGTTVEDRCSGWAVNRRVRESAESAPDSKLARLLPDEPGDEARLLSRALAEADPRALRIVDETAAFLAFALSHVVHLFHPEVIVLGGGLALIGEPWREAVARHLPRHLMDGFAPGPAVRLASLGEHVVPIGMLHLTADLIPD